MLYTYSVLSGARSVMTKNMEEQPESDSAREGDERTWVASGFTARVIKNEDDEG